MRILITDGPNGNSLAIARVLGKTNYIGIASRYKRLFTLCAYSRHTKCFHQLRSQVNNIDANAQELLKIIREENYEVLIPVGLRSYLTVSKHKAEFLKIIKVAIADWDEMQTAYIRTNAMNLARKLDIPVPTSISVEDRNVVRSVSKYPVILKHSSSQQDLVKFCNDADELEHYILKLNSLQGTILQDYVNGFGCGFYGIYDCGSLVAHYMHKRILEFPITGGASAVAESYFDDRLFEYGHRLCSALHWHGPIMAEFKYDIESKDYKLIEINPKLWGSLDLTINAGVNVPELLVDIALQRKTQNYNYKALRYHWLFPNQFKVLMSDCNGQNLKYFSTSIFRRQTNMDFRDPFPTFFQIGKGLIQGAVLLVDKDTKYPYGKLKTQ